MKWLPILSVLLIALVMDPGVSLAQGNLSIPLTITPPPPKPEAFAQTVTQAVSGTVTISGASYTVTGTLTGTLTCTPTTSSTEVPVTGPMVVGTSILAPNRLEIDGQGFGEQGPSSRVELDTVRLEPVSWLDTLIVADTTPFASLPPAAMLLVWQGRDSYYLSLVEF